MGLRELESLTYDDIKPIVLSFKKNMDDFELYKWILSHSGKSNFIKDKLNKAKAAEEGNLKVEKINAKPISSSKLIDF